MLDANDAGSRFVLSLYAKAGVSSACHSLQDRLNEDVVYLLFAAYLGACRGIALDSGKAADAMAAVTAWRREIVLPLRTLRVRLKSGPAPAPSIGSDAFRNRVKAIEIEAEMIQFRHLETLAHDWPSSVGSLSLAARNMHQALTTMTGFQPSTEDTSDLQTIATAIDDVARDSCEG